MTHANKFNKCKMFARAWSQCNYKLTSCDKAGDARIAGVQLIRYVNQRPTMVIMIFQLREWTFSYID